jgi:hypothetical protein
VVCGPAPDGNVALGDRCLQSEFTVRGRTVSARQHVRPDGMGAVRTPFASPHSLGEVDGHAEAVAGVVSVGVAFDDVEPE